MTIPKLVAHRGYMRHYPENTLCAIQAALDSGADYIEFDIQLNADHDFIVIHDQNFKRTSGIDQPVFTATTQTCKAISVHEPKRYQDKFYPEPVSLLGDVLTLIRQHPKATALVEIKKESLHHWGYVTVMDKLITELTPYHRQCMLISFDDIAIEYTQQNSDLCTGWVLDKYNKAHYDRAKELQADILMCNYKKIPKGETPWSDFKRWMLYDIMDPECVIRYGNLGVELIETGDIGNMLKNPALKVEMELVSG